MQEFKEYKKFILLGGLTAVGIILLYLIIKIHYYY